MSAVATTGIHTLWNDRSRSRARTVFAAQGIRCANCSRRVVRAVRELPGIDRIDVNGAIAGVSVDWDAACTHLADIFAAVDNVDEISRTVPGEDDG